MASKVNVKFVAILSVSLVAFAGVVGVAGYMLVFKSGAERARIGDKLAAAGEWDQARRSYAKAVNKEPTTTEYLVKWADAIGHVAPASEIEYRDLLLNDLLSAYIQLSSVETMNVDMQKQLLDFVLDQFRLSDPTPEMAMSMMNRANNSIERFEQSPPADDAWKTLYRYRGIPLATAMNAGHPLEEPLRTQARTDLEAALVGDPSDEVAAVALGWWHAAVAVDLNNKGQTDLALEEMSACTGVLESFLRANPGSPRAMLELVVRDNQTDIIRATRGLLADDAARVQRERQADMAVRLPEVAQAIEAAPAGAVDPITLMMFSRVEAVADPESRLAVSARLGENLLGKEPLNAQLLLTVADIDERRGQLPQAMSRFDRIVELKTLPVSLEGFVQLNLRRDAMYNRARLRLDQVLQDPTAASVPSELAKAEANRQEFAQQVSNDDVRLLMLDGMIAQAKGDTTTARESYRRYNEQTLQNDPVGLWRQTQTALLADAPTEAETLLQRMLQLQPGNLTATRALAEVYYRQGSNELALRLFESVADIGVSDQLTLDRITELRALVNPEDTRNDPVAAARARGRMLREGTAEEPGNLEAAAEFLEERVRALGYPEMLTVDLIQNELDLSRIDEARAVAEAAVAANPDNPRMQRFVIALQADSVTEALLTLIDGSDRSDIDKAITKYRLYLSKGNTEAAQAQLDLAASIDPEYPTLVDTRFDNAIGSNNLKLAEELAAVATKLNLDKAGGALYRARVLTAKGDNAEAVSLLERVIAEGKTFPMAFRLLSGAQAQQGRYDLAIQTLQRALSLNKNDAPTQLQYIRTLTLAGRTGDALLAARAAHETGRSPQFLTNAWLELEAAAGGDEGRAAAIVRRESMRSLQPDDRQNNMALAELYVLTRQFAKAQPLIEALRREDDSLQAVILNMQWLADQGRLLIDRDPTDSTPAEAVDGLAEAQRIFQDYLLGLDESELTATPFMAYARFMIGRNQIDPALTAIERARELQTDGTMEAEKLLGDLYYSRGRFADAAEVFGELVDKGADTDDQSYLKRLIECQIRVGQYESGMASLQNVKSPDLTTMLQNAEILFGLGRVGEARAALDQAVQKYPTNPLVYVRRAEANVGNTAMSGDVTADLQAALRIDPTNWRALRLRGVLAWEEGRQQQAITDIRAAVASNPQLEQLLFGLMNELIVLGQDGDAADIADDTIKARPTDAQLMLNCARVFANHELWPRATGFTRQAWNLSKDPKVGVLLVDSLVRLSPPRDAEAEAVYNQLVQLAPDSAQSMLMLATEATVRHAQGRENSAVRALTQALQNAQESPTDVLAWGDHVRRVYRDDEAAAGRVMKEVSSDPSLQISDLKRGWLTLVTAQQLVSSPSTISEGISLLRVLRERDDQDPLAQLAYRIEGTTLYSADDFEGAYGVWTEGLARFPADWEMLNNQAYLLGSKLDRAEEALPLAERAMQLSSDQMSSFDTLAMVYMKLGRFDDAAKTLQDAAPLVDTAAKEATINIARIRLHLAKGEVEQARKLSTDTRSIVFGSIGLEEMAKALDELDAQIDSASP